MHMEKNGFEIPGGGVGMGTGWGGKGECREIPEKFPEHFREISRKFPENHRVVRYLKLVL